MKLERKNSGDEKKWKKYGEKNENIYLQSRASVWQDGSSASSPFQSTGVCNQNHK